MPLTRNQLDAAGCATPNCGHDHTVLYLLGACHPKAATSAVYDKRTGTIKLTCHECERPVAEIAVA